MGGVGSDRRASLDREDIPAGDLRTRLVEVALVVVSFFTLAFLLYASQFSGTVRWFLGIIAIAAVAVYAWRRVSAGTREPPPLVPPPPLARAHAGELEAFMLMVRRAIQGLPYSQASVSSRAREAFEERVRLARGLSYEGMRALERDAATLEALLHEPRLADFLYVPSWDAGARFRWVEEARAQGGFDVELTRILDRMEAWR